MKKVLGAGVGLLALALAMPASAADLPVRAPVYKAPPPVVVAYSWTGCYVGGHGGGMWVQKDYSLGNLGFGGFGFGNNDLGSHDTDSWIAGFQAGCNYQFAGGFVVGIQGDYAWSDAEGSHDPLVGFGLPGLVTLHSKVDNLASVTGRVGYAWDRFLGYVKGGVAWEKDKYAVYDTLGFFVSPGYELFSASHTRTGWTIGVGGEYAFSNWITGFAEYNYYDFGTKGVTFNPNFGFGFIPGIPVDVDETKSVFKVGLNFKWGSTVTARY